MEQNSKKTLLAEYQRQIKKDRVRYLVLCGIGIISFLLIWQLVVQLNLVNTRNLPSVTEVLKTAGDKLTNSKPDGNTLGVNIVSSLKVALFGYLLAVVIGIPLGLLMGWYKIFDKFVSPIFELIRPIPSIAWIPAIILWFGIGIRAKAVIIFLSAFVPCVINSYLGIKSTNETLINVAKTFGASSFYIFRHVAIPSAVPSMLTGARVALNNSWTSLVAAELLAANSGLGYMISMGRMLGRADIVVTGMVVIGILGALLSGVLTLVEKKLLAWRER